MSFNPPTQQINTYNPTYWAFANPSFLSLQQAYLTFLPLKGGTLTGSLYAPQLFLSGDITSTGGINLTNVASQVLLANTSASTSSSTGALIIPSGGIYVGNNSIFNSSINMTASTSLLTLSGINSQINISNNFSASISSSTGALLCSGGAYFGNNSIISGTLSGISTLTATNLSGTLTTAAQTNITSVGNLTSLTMFGDINMSGHQILNASNITLSSTLTNSSTTDSSSISTGSIITSGGLGIAKSVYIGSNLNIASTTRITGQNSPASGSGLELAFNGTLTNIYSFNRSTGTYLDINFNDKMYLTGSSGNFSISGTTDSSSITTGIFNVSGGVGISKSLYVGTALNLINATTSAVLTLDCSATTSNHCNILYKTDTQSWEFGARGSTASNPNTMYWYNGGYKMLLNTSGQLMLNSTQNTAGLTIGGQNALGVMVCNSTSNQNYSAIFGTSTTGSVVLQAQDLVTPLSAEYTFTTSGFLSIGQRATAIASPRCPLDMGTYASDMNICLYSSGTAGSSYYGLGANNSNIEYSSAGGHAFYYNSTLTSNTPTLGTLTGYLNSAGNFISLAGLHANSFSTTGLSSYGMCAHMHYAGSQGSFFTYNYNTSTYGVTNINNNNIICNATGLNNMNSSNTTCSFPLSVFGSGTASRSSGGYGWLASSGAGNVGSASFTNRAFSCYMDYGILVGTAGSEIDCFSDIRIKKNIVLLDNDLVTKFINNIEPISFQYKENESTTKNYGYKAQQLVEHLFTDLVGFTDLIEDHDLEPEDIKCIDGSIVHLKDNQKLVVSLLNVIPILHQAIKLSNDKILNNNKMIHQLQTQINNLQNNTLNTSDTPGLDTLNIEPCLGPSLGAQNQGDFSLLRVVTESNYKQQAINNNFDQRIALTEQNRIIYESRIADLEKKMNLLGINSIW